MSSPPALRWRSVPIEAIASREWDGEFVVRNERSGSSHLLGPLAGQVLQILLNADRPLSGAEVAGCLRREATGGPPDLIGEIDTVLAEFKRLGLAEPVPT